MQVISALKTDLSLTFRTLNHFFVKGFAPDKPLAARFGAPAHQRIFIYFRIAFECLILFEEFRIVIKYVLNFFQGHFVATEGLRTHNHLKLVLLNF